jgi:hypothetical protein
MDRHRVTFGIRLHRQRADHDLVPPSLFLILNFFVVIPTSLVLRTRRSTSGATNHLLKVEENFSNPSDLELLQKTFDRMK